MNPEIWKPIPDFPRYEASSFGRVRSLHGRQGPRDTPLVMRDARSGSGYRAVVLWNESGKKQLYVHQIVLLAFSGRPGEGQEGAHLDGTRTNNRLENLRWVSREENHAHKIVHGTTLRGEQGSNVRLKSAEVLAMRALYRPGVRGYGTHALAARFGVSQGHAHNIVTGQRWAHLSALGEI